MLHLEQLREENIKRIDENEKKLVFGYIRQMQKSLHINHIHDLVIYTCLLFYSIPECFEIYQSGIIGLLSNKTSITKIGTKSDWDNITYGHQLIKSNTNHIIKWTFKIHSIHETVDLSMRIGIATVNGNNIDRNNENDKFYWFANSHKAGDTIILTLDLNTSSLSYVLISKNTDKQTSEKQIKKSDDTYYRLVVSIFFSGDSISIIDHQTITQNTKSNTISNWFNRLFEP